MQEKVDTLLEQITFLGEKQKDLYANSISSFDDLLSEIEGKLKTAGQGEQDLKWVFDHISEYKKDSTQDIQDDIKFLEEQVTALDQIRSMQDSAKAEELLNMIIDPKEELLSTKEFKERVEQDIAICKKDLKAMVDDIKGILEEGDYAQLKLLLEVSSDCDCDDNDCDCCEEDDDCDCNDDQDVEDASELDCSGCCSSCSSNCGPDLSDEALAKTDIFEEFAKLDKDNKEKREDS
jgi:hypothetical protein